jgi:GNAT superfamily N-acetyltransferase
VSVAVWVAAPREASAVAGLMGEFRDWMGRNRPTDSALAASVERLIADPGAEYLLAAPSTAAEPAAVCQLRYRYGVWHSAEDCWLEDLFVREAVRGRRLGGELVEAAVERARARGCRRVELDADSDNSAALALYERLGFSADTPSGAKRLMLRLAL